MKKGFSQEESIHVSWHFKNVKDEVCMAGARRSFDIDLSEEECSSLFCKVAICSLRNGSESMSPGCAS